MFVSQAATLLDFPPFAVQMKGQEPPPLFDALNAPAPKMKLELCYAEHLRKQRAR
jgi:hypothetical protein